MTTVARTDVRPFRQIVLKVHGQCNLACDYCYVYEHGDQSWRDRPRAMSPGDRRGRREPHRRARADTRIERRRSDSARR